MVRRLACVAVLVSALLGTGQVRADADPLTVSLEYKAPAVCPDVVDFKTIVSNRLGYEAFVPDARDHVQVELLPAGQTFEGRIEWRTAEGKWAGERKFPSRSGDCHELVRAMGFALALQIQFSAATGTRPGVEPSEPEEPKTEPAAPPPAKPEEPRQVEPPAPPKPPEPAAAVSELTYALCAGGALGYGMSSKKTPLARVFANLGWRSLVAEIGGELSWPTRTWREDGAGFSQQLILASLAGCGVWERWSACLLAKGGLIRIGGRNIDAPATPSGSIFQAGLRLGWTQPIAWRLFAAAHAAGLVNLTQWRVTLDSHEVWTSPRLAATFGLDLGVSLP